jgi:hypothetical protein
MLLRVLCENPQALGALVQGAVVCAKGPLVFVCAWGAGRGGKGGRVAAVRTASFFAQGEGGFRGWTLLRRPSRIPPCLRRRGQHQIQHPPGLSSTRSSGLTSYNRPQLGQFFRRFCDSQVRTSLIAAENDEKGRRQR